MRGLDTPGSHPGAVRSERHFILRQFPLLSLDLLKPQFPPDVKLAGLFGIDLRLRRTFLARTALGTDAVLNASVLPVTRPRTFILAHDPRSGILRD